MASEISSPQSDLPSSILPALGTLQIDGKSYELASNIPNKRGKTSWIWKNGLKLLDLSDPDKPKRVWMCRLYYDTGKSVLYSVNSTTHVSSHLKDSHQLINRDSALSTTSTEETPERYIDEGIDIIRFKEHLIRWIITMHISFS
jgi:hypothetical protein